MNPTGWLQRRHPFVAGFGKLRRPGMGGERTVTKIISMALTGLILASSGAVLAQVPDRRAAPVREGAAGAAAAPKPAPVEIVFSDAEKRIITDYFRKEGRSGLEEESANRSKDGRRRPGQESLKNLPVGLGNRDVLPPGIDKRGSLPPGLARRNLPSGLVSQLPPVASGTERVIIGDDVILVRRSNNVILDILRGAVSGGQG